MEVYNLADDLGETKNLADDKPEIVAKALKCFEDARSESEFWPLKEVLVDRMSYIVFRD